MSNEWHRFQQVPIDYILSGHRVFRSSAPNYNNQDSDQNLTQTAVDFLRQYGITNIISVNQHKYKDVEIDRLDAADIQYRHLPIPDFQAPSLKLLRDAVQFFRFAAGDTTLVHCGYGHGRTGTIVTALQLFSTSGSNPPESNWGPPPADLDPEDLDYNKVEEDSQKEVLRQLRSLYKDEL